MLIKTCSVRLSFCSHLAILKDEFPRQHHPATATGDGAHAHSVAHSLHGGASGFHAAWSWSQQKCLSEEGVDEDMDRIWEWIATITLDFIFYPIHGFHPSQSKEEHMQLAVIALEILRIWFLCHFRLEDKNIKHHEIAMEDIYNWESFDQNQPHKVKHISKLLIVLPAVDIVGVISIIITHIANIYIQLTNLLIESGETKKVQRKYLVKSPPATPPLKINVCWVILGWRLQAKNRLVACNFLPSINRLTYNNESQPTRSIQSPTILIIIKHGT